MKRPQRAAAYPNLLPLFAPIPAALGIGATHISGYRGLRRTAKNASMRVAALSRLWSANSIPRLRAELRHNARIHRPYS